MPIDSTEQLRAQDAIRVSEGFRQALLDSSLATIAVISRDGTILAVNETWRSFTRENGLASGQPVPGTDVGANYLAACQANTADGTAGAVAVGDSIRAVLDGCTAGFHLEYPCHSPHQQRWYRMSVMPLDAMAPGAAVITHTDITERSRNEQAVRIAAIAFECQEGIVVMDANQTILQVNQAFTHITGYSQSEAEGRTTAITRSNSHPASFFEGVSSTVYEGDCASFRAAIWREIKNAGAWQGDMWQRRKNGDEYRARVTTTAVKNAQGQVTHYVGNLTDVTSGQIKEQQRLRNEAAQRQLLVREVHHRIKNNLQGITGLLRQFAQTHPETADPINQAIGQVQGISVIYGLQGGADTTSVRLCELTVALATECAALWQTPVSVNVPSAWLPCRIAEKEAVPIALVLHELIVNAVKHGGRAQGEVQITLTQGPQPNGVQISISNTGQLATPGALTGARHSGLQLVAALMPPHGARLVRTQQGDRVITLLALEPPVIFQDLKDPR